MTNCKVLYSGFFPKYNVADIKETFITQANNHNEFFTSSPQDWRKESVLGESILTIISSSIAESSLESSS